VPRSRQQIVASLEGLYREAYARASDAGDADEMTRLDFAFRRDQLYLEALLDVRDSLSAVPASAAEGKKDEKSVLEQINELRSLARLPFGR
jgi:hypothetical protein